MQKDIKILVVDDMRMILLFISETLDKLGYKNVVTSTNGLDAYKKLRNGDFDLLITDWKMPEMSGLELLTKIRADEKLKNLSVIMVTASTEEDFVKKAITEGVNDYVVKPVKAEILENKITAILKKNEINIIPL